MIGDDSMSKIKITKRPIKAETDAEMTKRHEKEYAAAKANMIKKLQEMLDFMEMMPGNLFEDMDLGVLYEEVMDALQTNKR